MTARHYYRDDTNTLVEQTAVPLEGWSVTESAEEGTTPISQLTILDPSSELDYVGHRRWIIHEDESTDTENDVLFSGFVADQAISRAVGENAEFLGRVWQVSLSDMNALWGRRLERGSDCKRPAETDYARMTWMFGSSEMGYLDDSTTYVPNTNTVSLDAAPLRGQYTNQIADDCAQASGKNWWMACKGVAGATEIFAWYDLETATTYSSELFLSNDPLDLDEAAIIAGTATVWPISEDTALKRDPARIYSGVYLPYDGGAIYRHSAATEAQFVLTGRDFTAPSLNVKSKTKAIARANRYLADLDTQDERITTTVEVPNTLASKIRAGMRIRFKATHLPGYTSYVWCRILNLTLSPIAAGRRYRLELELSGPGTAATGGGALGSVTLSACNTVVENSLRSAADNDTGPTFAAGQVWQYTLSQSSHGGDAYTHDFALTWDTIVPTSSSTVIRGWGVSVLYPLSVGYPIPQPNQGSYPAYTALSETGTFVITSAGTGRFSFYANADYPVAASVDECWTILLERLS